MTIRELVCCFQVDSSREDDFRIEILEPRVDRNGKTSYSVIMSVGSWCYLVDYPEFKAQSRKHRKFDTMTPREWRVLYNRDKTVELKICLAERFTKPRKPVVDK